MRPSTKILPLPLGFLTSVACMFRQVKNCREVLLCWRPRDPGLAVDTCRYMDYRKRRSEQTCRARISDCYLDYYVSWAPFLITTCRLAKWNNPSNFAGRQKTDSGGVQAARRYPCRDRMHLPARLYACPCRPTPSSRKSVDWVPLRLIFTIHHPVTRRRSDTPSTKPNFHVPPWWMCLGQ